MDSSTIQIANLDPSIDNRKLEEIFSDHGPLKRCFVVKKTRKGIVQFALNDDVNKLFEETNGKLKFENDNVLELQRIPDEKPKGGTSNAKKDFEQSQHDKKAAKEKKSRLIIRNLSFKATDDKIKSHFSTYGDVVDVNILKKKDGKMVGCAFLQYSNVQEASKALKNLNGKLFLQRPIAIDWAVPKDQFQQSNPKPNAEEKEETADMSDPMEDKDESNEMDNEDQNIEDHEDDSKSSEGGSISDGDGEDEVENEMQDGEQNIESPPKKQKWPEKGHDIGENKTVFVRNLSFKSDEQDFKDMMEYNFGKVLFARFVIDKVTEHPKGSAFVKFASEESVQKCIEASESQDGLWLDSRQIYAISALRPDEAKQKQDDKKVNKKEEKDSRNLYLSREGLIREGTKAAIGVSKSDLQLRVNLEKRKKEMLKDLNRFISKDRLCVRNLPLEITDDKLKALVLKFVEPKPKIAELKVMKDMKTGKNKGFAFVSLANHEMALQVLRNMNNNPEVFHKDQRPIIEFSIENRKALNARQKRLEKSREKNPTFKSNGTDDDSEKGRYVKIRSTASTTTPKKGKKSPKNEKLLKKTDENESLEEKKPEFMGSTNKPGQKSLPSHIGPKIRHNRSISRKDIKKKEKLMKNPRKRKALNESLSQNNPEDDVSKSDKATEPKAKKAKKNKSLNKKKISKSQVKDMMEEKQFSKMVQQYKQKLLVPKSAKKSKWFE